MTNLTAEKRDMSVKAKKLRRDGFVVGNVFGRDMKETMPIQIPKKEAESFIKSNTKGSQVVVTVGEQKINALVKAIDYNPMKKEIEEISFQMLVAGEVIHATAPIELTNHDKALGIAQQFLSEVSYKADAAALIDKVVIDLADLKIGSTIKVQDLAIAKDKDIEIMTPMDSLVVTVTEAPKEEETDADVEEAAAE